MGSVMREITSPTNRLVYKINENDQISTIIIAINKTNDLKNINIDKGTIVCSVEELEDEKQLLSFISKFFQIIRMTYKINPNPQFNIIVNTKEEEAKLKNIAELLNQNNIKCYIIETEEYKQQKQLQSNQVEQIKEEQKEVLATGSKEIVKQGPNGEILKYVESNGKIYDNNFNISIQEQKQQLLDEWSKEPVNSNEIIKKSPETLDAELTKIVTYGQKQYDLNDTNMSNQQTNNEYANIANNISKQEDGKVNTELGIVQNGVNNSREFTVVEQTNNGYNVVTPTTTEQTISSSTGINTSTSTSDDGYNIDNNSQLLNDGIDTRDVLNNIYYIDDYTKEIYNSNGELIGTIGSNYYIDMNNHLVKNNEVIGTIENIKDMPMAKTTAKKRVLEKPNGYISFLLFSIIISLALITYIVIKLT